jgi:hypothetical protein
MTDNPLRQYFRRPALYLKLPSGGNFYPADSIDMPENGEVPIYPMTAIDEITSKTPDALYNGVAVTDIIKSCVPSIKNPWVIPAIDIDPILVAIRAASGDGTLELESTCPKCDDSSSYGVNLSGILQTYTPGDYNTPLDLGELKVKFKPLSYKQINDANIAQTELQRAMIQASVIEDDDKKLKESSRLLSAINNITLSVICESIEHVQTPTLKVDNKEHIMDFLKNSDRNTYERIKNTSIELRASTETKPLKLKCISCSHDYEQPFVLNVSDFFA